MNILLAGVTGVIGRGVLAELLSQDTTKESKIICLARNSAYAPAASRIQSIVAAIAKDLDKSEKELYKALHIVDISNDVPRSYSTLVQYLGKAGIKDLRVIHMASTTNLSTLASSEDEIYTQSYLSTLDLFEKLLPYIKQFSFVSTAFSCGHQQGLIPSEYGKLTVKANRNYYERFKLEAERKIRHICEQRGIQWQILRPSIVCGQLLKQPYYFMPKFNMFYAWTRFFHDLKTVGMNCKGIRIKANINSDINIVPSDYTAKAIVRAFVNESTKELNIVHSQNLSMSTFITTMLHHAGIDDFEMVDNMPQQPTVAEKLYYETTGLQMGPYLNTPQHKFDTLRLRELMADVSEPAIEEHFDGLLKYAVLQDFKDIN